MALLVLVVVAGLAALFLIPGSTPRMDIRRYPNRLAVLEQVPVNGTQQWILIRSESTTNPVVLFVHGGPGTSWLTLMRKTHDLWRSTSPSSTGISGALVNPSPQAVLMQK